MCKKTHGTVEKIGVADNSTNASLKKRKKKIQRCHNC